MQKGRRERERKKTLSSYQTIYYRSILGHMTHRSCDLRQLLVMPAHEVMQYSDITPRASTPNPVTQKSPPSWICKRSKSTASGVRREAGEAWRRLYYGEVCPLDRWLNIVKAVRHRWLAVHSFIYIPFHCTDLLCFYRSHSLITLSLLLQIIHYGTERLLAYAAWRCFQRSTRSTVPRPLCPSARTGSSSPSRPLSPKCKHNDHDGAFLDDA